MAPPSESGEVTWTNCDGTPGSYDMDGSNPNKNLYQVCGTNPSASANPKILITVGTQCLTV